MKVNIEIYELNPNSATGYGIQITATITSFNKEEIDKLSDVLDAKNTNHIYMNFGGDQYE